MSLMNAQTTRSVPKASVTIAVGIVTCIAMGIFFRGPCYGLALGAFVGVVAGTAVLLVLRRLKPSRFYVLNSTITAIIALAIVYLVLSPPSAGTILKRYIGLRDLQGITKLQVFHAYGRDPAFGVKCVVTDQALTRIVTNIGVPEDSEPRPAHEDPFYFYTSPDEHDYPSSFFSVPQWWRPGDIKTSRTWTHVGEFVVPWLTLRYETETGLVYLVVMWH